MQERQGTRVASSDEGQRRQRPALEDAVHLCHEPLPVQPKQGRVLSEETFAVKYSSGLTMQAFDHTCHTCSHDTKLNLAGIAQDTALSIDWS